MTHSTSVLLSFSLPVFLRNEGHFGFSAIFSISNGYDFLYYFGCLAEIVNLKCLLKISLIGKKFDGLHGTRLISFLIFSYAQSSRRSLFTEMQSLMSI